MGFVAVYITAPNHKEAKKIGRMLVRERLVACVNIIPRADSVYVWKNRLESHPESVIIGKTTSAMRAKIIRAVKNIHSYEVPCINFLPVASGNPDYLGWVKRETKTDKHL